MKITCGTDIIEIERVKDSIESLGNRFINRIFTEKEIKYCESKNSQKYQHYAARFASKEAIFKAINDQMTIEDKANFSWKNFEIINDENGKPNILLHCEIDSLQNIDISISHCKEYAVAYVIASFN